MDWMAVFFSLSMICKCLSVLTIEVSPSNSLAIDKSFSFTILAAKVFLRMVGLAFPLDN